MSRIEVVLGIVLVALMGISFRVITEQSEHKAAVQTAYLQQHQCTSVLPNSPNKGFTCGAEKSYLAPDELSKIVRSQVDQEDSLKQQH